MKTSIKQLPSKLLFMVLIIMFFNGNMFAQEPQDEFKPSGKVWGYVFGDFYYKQGGDTATWPSKTDYAGVAKDVYAFTFRRIYLGYDYALSPKFSTTILLEGSDGVNTPKGDRTVFIKALNLRWKNIYKRGDLLIGQIPTPTWSLIAEKVWSYRSVEKTIADQRGIGRSNDVGIALFGTLDSEGNYGYNLMYGNGTGSKPESLTSAGRLKVYYGELYAYFLDKKILIEAYGDYEASKDDKNKITLKAFMAYQSDPFTAGVEVVSQTQQNMKSDDTDLNLVPFGVSVWARGTVIKDKLNAFARFDTFDPDSKYRTRDTIPSYNAANMFKHYKEKFITVGFDYMPHKNIHIMPNLWYNSYTAKQETAILIKRKADIVPRLTFYFIFK